VELYLFHFSVGNAPSVARLYIQKLMLLSVTSRLLLLFFFIQQLFDSTRVFQVQSKWKEKKTKQFCAVSILICDLTTANKKGMKKGANSILAGLSSD
jgi:hypothetical protein